MEIIIFIVFGFALLLVTDNSKCRRRIGYGTMPITKRPKVRPRPQK